MKLENIAVVSGTSYFGGEVVYTILMDFKPWRVYFYGSSYPGFFQNVDLKEFTMDDVLANQKMISDNDDTLEVLYQSMNPEEWRKDTEVIPEKDRIMICDGGSLTLEWRNGKKIREIHYFEHGYDKVVPFPEYEAMQTLIAYLSYLRAKAGICGGSF